MNWVLRSFTVTCLLLSGCYQSVNLDDLSSAIKTCKEHKADLVAVDSYWLGSEVVQCSDRVNYRI